MAWQSSRQRRRWRLGWRWTTTKWSTGRHILYCSCRSVNPPPDLDRNSSSRGGGARICGIVSNRPISLGSRIQLKTVVAWEKRRRRRRRRRQLETRFFVGTYYFNSLDGEWRVSSRQQRILLRNTAGWEYFPSHVLLVSYLNYFYCHTTSDGSAASAAVGALQGMIILWVLLLKRADTMRIRATKE